MIIEFEYKEDEFFLLIFLLVGMLEDLNGIFQIFLIFATQK